MCSARPRRHKSPGGSTEPPVPPQTATDFQAIGFAPGRRSTSACPQSLQSGAVGLEFGLGIGIEIAPAIAVGGFLLFLDPDPDLDSDTGLESVIKVRRATYTKIIERLYGQNV